MGALAGGALQGGSRRAARAHGERIAMSGFVAAFCCGVWLLCAPIPLRILACVMAIKRVCEGVGGDPATSCQLIRFLFSKQDVDDSA